ncbi:Type-F conjugative transfer system pilin assembly protein [compost metagenome]
MLPTDSLMKKPLQALALVATLALGSACAHANPSEEPAPSGAETGAFYVPYGNLSNLKPEDIERAKKLGESVVTDLLQAYEQRKDDPGLAASMANVKRRADDIANAAAAADRSKVLKFLGLDPEGSTSLYFFVSWSMPLSMLRSYAIEAMWAGGTLVFRGLPPGRDFNAFLGEDVQQLTYGKGAAAAVSIDPRLYDAYKITAVPSIVLTTVRADLQCVGINPVSFKYRGQDLSYDTCPQLDESKYFKMSGGVTTNYALQAFVDDGVTEAKPYLKALARGFATGQVPGKEQQPFSGKWEDVLSPSERLAIEEGVRQAMTAAQRGEGVSKPLQAGQ